MSPGPLFHVGRGVLQLHEPPPRSRDLLFLCWPVFVYRVIAPVLRVRHLNIIEKVVLGLCHAGVREPADIAARIHQDKDLCEYVLRQLRGDDQIDRSGELTEKGGQTLLTSRVGEDPELIVTHVFQDPLTLLVWPRASAVLYFQPVRRVHDEYATLRLDTAGSPRRITSYVVSCEPDPARTRTPSAAEIIDSVEAQRVAEIARRAEKLADGGWTRNPAAYDAEQDLQALTSELTLPHGTAVQRVLDIGEPQPEYLLVWLRTGGERQDGRAGWHAHDPFGLDPNPMFQRLVNERIRSEPELARVVTGLADVSDEQLRQRYRATAGDVRRSAEPKLVQLLGSELRERHDALDLLLGMEDAAARGGSSGLETVARDAYRLYEHMFRRMAEEYPPPPEPSWQVGPSLPALGTVRSALMTAAERLGLKPLPVVFIKDRQINDVRRYPQRIRNGEESVPIQRAFVNQLVPYALVAGADSRSRHQRGHPLRALAARRPRLLRDLVELSELRNRGSHAQRDPTVEDDIEWCRQLAIDAARIIILMPPQDPERS